MDYGAFVRLEDGIEGLIHSSELSWTNKNVQPAKVLSASQEVKVKIVTIDSVLKEFLYLIEKLYQTHGKKLKVKWDQLLR